MTPEFESAEGLRALARGMGLELFGVADITAVRPEFLLQPETRDRFDRALVLGRRLVAGVLDDLRDSPTALYLHHYRQVNFLLDRAALAAAGFIQERGYGALPIAASQIVDWDNQKAHVSHKKVGALAGLGWLGRNNLLVHPVFGAQFRLVTVLTDMPLTAGAPPARRDCGECRRCLAACPAQAIKESPAEFDHRACFAQLQDFRRRGLVSQFICGLCVKACRGARSLGR